MKATVTSPSNIAFIKYWGARDLEQIVPENPSLSMTLGACTSRTTVEYLEDGGSHDVRWRSSGGAALETPPPAFSERVVAHLDRLKTWAGVDGRFRMATENTFPAAAGIASSASGFSALTLAVLAALGREASDEMRSRLARRSGSGSASRSVLGGYVRWPAAGLPGDAGNFAQQVAPAAHWDLRDVIALAATQAKGVSSLDGHRRARTSPHFARRLELLPDRYATVEKALLDRDFDTFGAAMEAEAIEL
ncbi:MAG: diphosphomevalonate decarboxylase, partial [Acidobacteriota bacterium]